MNVKLLKQVRDHILEEPRRLNMSLWLTRGKRYKHRCKTVGCIAGWGSVLSGKKDLPVDFGTVDGAAIFGLTQRQAQRLFYVDNWPSKFACAFWEASRGDGEAKVTAKRINHFIKTKGLK